ncbi:MAG: extracellular solute-binding protein [Bacteroidota bacterium]
MNNATISPEVSTLSLGTKKQRIKLKGITWGHSRGLTPLLAFAQRFNELHPAIEITWTKRSLQEFADQPLEDLTQDYDLLIIDHPWVGCAAATKCVLPLDEYLSPEFMADQLKNTVGQSHLSYEYNGHQWALAIDAATPVASFRPDLFKKAQLFRPLNWEELLALADKGKVAVPGIPIDLLMNFFMFCIANGKEPFQNKDEVIDVSTGTAALLMMQELYRRVDPKMFELNPIAVAELMSAGDDYWYCPFAYCYSNYSRNGYAKNLLQYTDMISVNDAPLRSTLGGTGIAVSAFSKHPKEALEFAAAITSSSCQSTFYVQHGGQPGHRSAWVSKEVNQLCNDFFKNTLPAIEKAYVRPRYNGYLHFQDRAGHPIRDFLMNGGYPSSVIKGINLLYKDCVNKESNRVL